MLSPDLEQESKYFSNWKMVPAETELDQGERQQVKIVSSGITARIASEKIIDLVRFNVQNVNLREL